MRSRLALLLALLPTAALLRCDHRSDRVEDICEVLEKCTDYFPRNPDSPVWSACEAELGDALTDQRVTRAGLTKCAACLGEHRFLKDRQDDCENRPCENCKSLMADRDCDSACAEVDFALRSRTSRGMRQTMCAVIDESCGLAGRKTCSSGLADLYKNLSGIDGSGGTAGSGSAGSGGSAGTGPAACTGGASAAAGASGGSGATAGAGGVNGTDPTEPVWRQCGPEPPPDLRGAELTLEEALTLDETVERCWRCTESVRKVLDQQRRADQPVRCATVVDTCAEDCALVRPARAVLEPASIALSLCALTTRCVEAPAPGGSQRLTRVISCTDGCPSASDSPGSGGSGGSGAGGMCSTAGTSGANGTERDASAGEGGVGGNDGEGGMGGAPDPVVQQASCFEERVRCTSSGFVQYATPCVECARDQECSVVAERCRSKCQGDVP